MHLFSKVKIPRQYDANKAFSLGDEGWSGNFIYPNGWSLSSFRKPSIKEVDNRATELPVNMDMPNGSSIILFFCFVLYFICSALYWKTQQSIESY